MVEVEGQPVMEVKEEQVTKQEVIEGRKTLEEDDWRKDTCRNSGRGGRREKRSQTVEEEKDKEKDKGSGMIENKHKH